MSITIEASVLAKAMKHAAAVVESRNTIPILLNVLLRADGDSLEIATSNLDVEFRQAVGLAEGGKLATTVDARRLAALASAAPKGSQLALSIDNGQLLVRCGRSRWKVPVLPVDDFPLLPFDAGSEALDLPAALVAEIFERVSWSRSSEESRYYLNGPLWHGEKGVLRVVTTNGHSLASLLTDIPFPASAPEVILAPKFCDLLQRIADDTGGTVQFVWDEKKIRAAVGDIVLTAKVIEGTFPDYRRVIPAESQTCTVDPEGLSAAVRRVRLLCSDRTHCVKVERGEGKWTLSQATPDQGSAQEEVPADAGSDVVTGFNAEYLDKMCAAVGGDSMAVDQVDGGHMALFRRTVPDGFVGVIMPIRV